MGKEDDFSKVIKVVTELTDVTDQDILGKSRKQEVVDARWMVMYFMHEKGYTTREISQLTLHPERTVRNAIHDIKERARFSCNGFGNIFFIVRQQVL
jgi:chromosomal replication initiation ATPase DnaA